MLTLTDSRFARRSSALGRRGFLRIGSLCGLALPALLAAKARAATEKNGYKNKSVVLLFLQGGPPQIETFDPKLNVPDNIRSCTGAMVARGTGAFNMQTGVPMHTVIIPEVVQADLRLGQPTGTFALPGIESRVAGAGTPVGMKTLGAQVDHAVAAFLDDLEQRGMSDDVQLVITGEMGRTPKKTAKDGGTNHHGSLTPLLLAGGGLKMGQTIGRSDQTGARPATTPYGPENLLATILHTLFGAGEVRISPDLVPTEVADAMLNSQPIEELV